MFLLYSKEPLQPGYDTNSLHLNDTTVLYAPQATDVKDQTIDLYCERCNFEVSLNMTFRQTSITAMDPRLLNSF